MRNFAANEGGKICYDKGASRHNSMLFAESGEAARL